MAIFIRLASTLNSHHHSQKTNNLYERERGEREYSQDSNGLWMKCWKSLRNFEITLLDQQASNQSINPFVWSNPNLLITIYYKPCNRFGRQHSLVYVCICMYIRLLDSLVRGGLKCTSSCFNTSCQNLLCSLCRFDTLKRWQWWWWGLWL
jgi:hypothetical protein